MVPDLPGEEWRDIPGYEDTHQVSNLGRVARLAPMTISARRAGRRNRIRLVKQHDCNYGNRFRVALCRHGKVKQHQVHRLMLLAFIGPCPDGMECRHLDGNHRNNVIENLCWGSRLENAHDRIRHGTHPRGEVSAASKLTEEQVREIRNSSEPKTVLARLYGVTPTAIYYARIRRTWAHIE